MRAGDKSGAGRERSDWKTSQGRVPIPDWHGLALTERRDQRRSGRMTSTSMRLGVTGRGGRGCVRYVLLRVATLCGRVNSIFFRSFGTGA